MLPFHNRRYILQLSEKKVWQGAKEKENFIINDDQKEVRPCCKAENIIFEET